MPPPFPPQEPTAGRSSAPPHGPGNAPRKPVTADGTRAGCHRGSRVGTRSVRGTVAHVKSSSVMPTRQYRAADGSSRPSARLPNQPRREVVPRGGHERDRHVADAPSDAAPAARRAARAGRHRRLARGPSADSLPGPLLREQGRPRRDRPLAAQRASGQRRLGVAGGAATSARRSTITRTRETRSRPPITRRPGGAAERWNARSRSHPRPSWSRGWSRVPFGHGGHGCGTRSDRIPGWCRWAGASSRTGSSSD
jgi:hypothetical protein